MIICFKTTFLCRDDDLSAAKRRYEARLDLVRQRVTVLLASEQAVCQSRDPNISTFRFLVTEIKPWEQFLAEELNQYGVYEMDTILAVPPAVDSDELFSFQELFDMDSEADWPVRFPCTFRWFRMSASGREENHLETV